MKQRDLIAFIVIGFLLATSLTSVAYTYINDIESWSTPYDVTIGSIIGFNADPDAVHFGALIPGKSASARKMEVENHKEHPIRVSLKAEGDYDEHVSIGPNDFVLMPEENRSISFSFRAPEEAPYGNYSGRIIIRTRNAKI